MKPILKQLAIFVIFLAFWYLLVFILSYILYPDWRGGDIIDTEEASKTIFQSPARYAVLGLPKLAKSSKKNVFLIGSSNVREGFRPYELRVMLPGYEVQNLGMGSSNITQANDVVDLIQVLPKSDIKNSIFVLGIWYGSFVDDKTIWGDGGSNVVREETRYGLYRFYDGQPQPIVEMKSLPYLITLLRPFLLLHVPISNMYEFIENLRTFMHKGFRERKIDFAVFKQNEDVAIPDETFKEKAFRFWSGYMGTKDYILKQEQFERLLEICRRLNESGARLIIVDMPLPRWHRDGSMYYVNYQQKKTFYINEALKFNNVRYFSMQESTADRDFRDSAHPSPSITKNWSLLLGTYIRSIIDGSKKV